MSGVLLDLCSSYQKTKCILVYLAPVSAVKVIESKPFVCVSVCLSALSRLRNRLTHDLDFYPPRSRGDISLAVSVCPSVPLSAYSRLNRLTHDLDIWHEGRP